MYPDSLILVLGMYIFPDASSALGKKVISCRRYIQLFVFIRGRDLDIGTGRDIDDIKRIILFCKAGCNLVINILLPLNLSLLILSINITKAHDHAGAFLLLDHGGLHLDIKRPAILHNAVIQSKNAAAPDLCQEIFHRKDLKDAGPVSRMAEDPCCFF